MNARQSKLLRRARLLYIADVLNGTPEGTGPSLAGAQQAADLLVKRVCELWPTEHRAVGRAVRLLERAGNALQRYSLQEVIGVLDV